MVALFSLVLLDNIKDVLHLLRRSGKSETQKITKRIYCFKHAHKLYWAKKLTNGVVEFWAYSSNDEEKWYLGKYENGVITECDGFYNYKIPWDVQHGANRMFDMKDMWI